MTIGDAFSDQRSCDYTELGPPRYVANCLGRNLCYFLSIESWITDRIHCAPPGVRDLFVMMILNLQTHEAIVTGSTYCLNSVWVCR